MRLTASARALGALAGRHRRPILDKVIKGVLTGVEHDDAPERSPFRKAA